MIVYCSVSCIFLQSVVINQAKINKFDYTSIYSTGYKYKELHNFETFRRLISWKYYI